MAAYPAETKEAFCDGHVKAFGFFGGVPRSILYDNTKIAVARILGDGVRQRTQVFSELQSHYLFEDRFGRPGKGNDKGKVEGLVGYARRNFLVPVPQFESFEALDAHLAACCRRRLGDRLRGHAETIGERLERDVAALRKPLPPPYDACEKVPATVSSLSLVRYRSNDYSVPTSFGHRQVVVRGYVHRRLSIWLGLIARVKDINCLTWILCLQEFCSGITWKDANLANRSVARISQGVLHEGWQNDNVSCRVALGVGFGSAFACPLKHNDDFFSLMVVPGNCDSGADDVLMDVRLRTQLFVSDVVSDAIFRTAWNLAKNSSKDGHPTLLRVNLRR